MTRFMRTDVCDRQTCGLARSGGGSSPIDLHGSCSSVAVVHNVGPRMRVSRCYEKCELRPDKKACDSLGSGGQMAHGGVYTDPKGKTASCGQPILMTDDGVITDDKKKGKPRVPQVCVGMCRWVADAPGGGSCFTSCEMRADKGKCEAGGCTWNDNGGFMGLSADSSKELGATEYGALPVLIPCTGVPTKALYDKTQIAQQAAAMAAAAGPGQKGGGGFGGPVSTCILAAVLAGKTQTAAEAACNVKVKLELDERFERRYVRPTKDKTGRVNKAMCKQFPMATDKFTLQIEIKESPASGCGYEGDGYCDVPDYCPKGTDKADCCPKGTTDADCEKKIGKAAGAATFLSKVKEAELKQRVVGAFVIAANSLIRAAYGGDDADKSYGTFEFTKDMVEVTDVKEEARKQVSVFVKLNLPAGSRPYDLLPLPFLARSKDAQHFAERLKVGTGGQEQGVLGPAFKRERFSYDWSFAFKIESSPPRVAQKGAAGVTASKTVAPTDTTAKSSMPMAVALGGPAVLGLVGGMALVAAFHRATKSADTTQDVTPTGAATQDIEEPATLVQAVEVVEMTAGQI